MTRRIILAAIALLAVPAAAQTPDTGMTAAARPAVGSIDAITG